MNKDIFKKAVDDIQVDQILIDKTIKLTAKYASRKPKPLFKRYIAAAACTLVFVLSILTFNNFSFHSQNHTLKSAALPEIKNNYIPFNAIQSSPIDSIKLESPSVPPNYQELKNNSTAVILCTIKNIGIYREKKEQGHPTSNFATYIYTAKIDKVLSGNINKDTNDLIPVAEKTWDVPTSSKDNKLKHLSIIPYTNRPKETKTLLIGNKYVMFLSNKDETGCYNITFSGFGMLPMDYITKVSQNYSIDELKKKYNYINDSATAPLVDDNLFKLVCLRTKEAYLMSK